MCCGVSSGFDSSRWLQCVDLFEEIVRFGPSEGDGDCSPHVSTDVPWLHKYAAVSHSRRSMPAKLTTPARAVAKASVTPKPAEGGTRKAAVVTPKNTTVKGDGFVGGVGKALVTGLEQLNRSGHQLLRRAGYDLPLLNNECKTTPESVEVLKKFQADHKLPTTGEFDTATVAAPKVGWTGFEIEMTWEYNDHDSVQVIKMSSEVNVVPDTMPFPSCGLDCQPVDKQPDQFGIYH